MLRYGAASEVFRTFGLSEGLSDFLVMDKSDSDDTSSISESCIVNLRISRTHLCGIL